MKTIREIQTEARQLTVLGEQYRNEQSSAALAVAPEPRVLARLSPEPSSVGSDSAPAPLVPRTERHVDAVLDRDELLYRLVEREPGLDSTLAAGGDATALLISSDAFDVLRLGYERFEEERLAEQLAPFAERNDCDRAETVAELETILEAELLPVADRLRTKSEIGEFLDGRLETHALIARTLDRQCTREGLVQAHTIRHELRLTIGEP